MQVVEISQPVIKFLFPDGTNFQLPTWKLKEALDLVAEKETRGMIVPFNKNDGKVEDEKK